MSFQSAAFDVGSIARDFLPQLEQCSKLSHQQRKVLEKMSICSTSHLGGHVRQCDHCGKKHYTFLSCRNRHCNKCGALKRDKWVAKRKGDALPIPYFHVVFTLPHQLNELALQQPRAIYNLLMRSAWATLKKFAANPKHLGADLGAVIVLHTWGQNLALHPHVHCLVPGGGVNPQGKWKMAKSKGKFLFSVKAMSKVFRGMFTDGLLELEKEGSIQMEESFDTYGEAFASALSKTMGCVCEKAHAQKRSGGGIHRALHSPGGTKQPSNQKGGKWKGYLFLV